MPSSKELLEREQRDSLFQEILEALNDQNVEYLVIDGYAAKRTAPAFAPGEIRLWIKPDLDNSTRTQHALSQFAPQRTGFLIALDLKEHGGGIELVHPETKTSILLITEVPGEHIIGGFEKAWANRILGVHQGTLANYIGVLNQVTMGIHSASEAKTLEEKHARQEENAAVRVAARWLQDLEARRERLRDEQLENRAFPSQRGERTPGEERRQLKRDEEAHLRLVKKEKEQER